MRLYVDESDTLLTEYAWGTTKQSVDLIYNNALDGTPYIQIIGNPAREISLKAVVVSAQKKAALEAVEAAGALVRCEDGSAVSYGYIVELKFKDKVIDGMQRCDIIIAKEVI